MKKTIRIISLLLALLLLCGCGAAAPAETGAPETMAQLSQNTSGDQVEPPQSPTEQPTQPAAETEPTQKPTEAPEEKTKLDVVVGWYGYEDQNWWQTFETEFESACPEIDLTVQVRSWAKLMNGLEETEEKPDILNISAGYAGDYRDQGMLLSADAYLSSGTRDSICPGLLNWYEEDGSVWGLPILSIPWVMVYNPEILDAAQVTVPSNWDELVEACRKIHTAMPEVIPWGMDLVSDETLVLWLMNNGGGLVDETGEWFINSDENLEAVELLRDMFRAGWLTEDLMTAEWSMLQDLFMEGKVAMLPMPLNGLNYWQIQPCPVPYALASMPANTGCESASVATVDYFVCFDKGQTAGELAAMETFFDFFYEAARHGSYAQSIGLYPVTTEAAMQMTEGKPELALLKQVLATARPLPIMKSGWLDIFLDLDSFWWEVLEDGEKPGWLLDELQFEAGGN